MIKKELFYQYKGYNEKWKIIEKQQNFEFYLLYKNM